MRTIIVTNKETMNGHNFLVTQLYDEDGFLADATILPFINDEDVIYRQLSEMTDLYPTDVLTSTKEIYGACIKRPGFNVQIRHESDTRGTGRQLAEQADIVKEIYNIAEPSEQETEITWIDKIKNYFKGER